jgi:hypothetical protein
MKELFAATPVRAQQKSRSILLLAEICLVLRDEFSLVCGQFIFGEDGVLFANIRAVATVDAIVGVDIDLGNGSCGSVTICGRNGSGGTIRYASEVLDAGICNYISHNFSPKLLFGALL